jgi:hypothetical protein
MMSKKDSRRKWMWLFLGVLALFQIYAVQELVAAFAIFALGFAVLAACVGSIYFLFKAWEAGVARLAESQNSMILAARSTVAVVEDWVRRPIRRPDSEAAH